MGPIEKALAGGLVLVLVAFGLTVGFLGRSSVSTSDEPADPAHTHEHGPDTHTHNDDGDVVGGVIMEAPDLPEGTESLLEPVRDDDGVIVTSADGKTEAWIDSAAVEAIFDEWIANGGDVVADGVDIGDNHEWWFDPPESNPLDPRHFVLFTDA